jgi:hypothetical protein
MKHDLPIKISTQTLEDPPCAPGYGFVLFLAGIVFCFAGLYVAYVVSDQKLYVFIAVACAVLSEGIAAS